MIDRIMFSNDTTTASIRNPLPENRTGAASSGNTSAMWIGGGSGGTTIVSSVLRLTFANDTSVLSTRGPLSLARDGLSSISDPNNSWFIGGTFSNQVGFTRIDRVTFSNDTTTASVRGNLSRPLIAFSAEGNTTDGWFGGGYREPNAFGLIIYSEIERIIFSNDTTTTSIRGSLSSFRMSVTSP